MTVPDAVIAGIVAALPGAELWDGERELDPGDLVVFDGIVPPVPPRRYVVVYADPGTVAALAVCARSDSATFRWQTTSVAPDRAAAHWLSTAVRDGTVDTRPAAAGWSCGPVRHTFSQLPQRDEQVMERPAVYAVDQYALLASRVLEPVESSP